MKRKASRLLSTLLVLCMALALLPGTALAVVDEEEPSAAVEALQDSGGLSKLSQKEITQLLQQNSLDMPGTIFESDPSLSAPYAPGKVSGAALQTAVNRLNALRRIAGLPSVVMDETLNESAQYGAVLLAVSEFSHFPKQPGDMDDAFFKNGQAATSSSNIHYGSGPYANLPFSVDSFMNDSDSSNIDRLGHRRWQLNPSMGKIGFGYVLDGRVGYVAEKVFDNSGSGIDYSFIAWPASGNFPTGYFFNQDTAWSVTLNPQKYGNPDSKVAVKLVRDSDGQTWNLSSGGKSGYFNIDNDGYGVSNCIIFRPDGVESYEGVYTVTITGLRTKSGTEAVISYQVDFFDPDGKEPERVPEPEQDPEPEQNPGPEQDTGPEHHFSDVWSYDAVGHWHDCTDAGCTEKSDEAKHAWDAGKVTAEPTFDKAGTKTYTCTVCKATRTESISRLEHHFSTLWSYDETGHWHDCTDAGCTEKSGEAKHTWDAGKVTVEPTYNTAGRKTYTCTVCKYTITESIPSTGGSGNTTPSAPDGITVTVNGRAVMWTDVKPFIDINDRTMVPLRAVAEAMDLTVDWDADAYEAIFTNGSKTICFPIGSITARTTDTSGAGTVTMDTFAVIVNDRTYAPIRYLAEYFGYAVGWDGVTQTVIITG